MKFLTIGIILFFHLQAEAFAEKLKFCLVDGKKTKKLVSSICPNLNKHSSNVECIIVTDRVSCLKLLINNKADFMTAEPEDLRVIGMTENYNNKILVTHELRIWQNERSSYQLVTIIRNSIPDVWHIAKKRFCSLGLEPNIFTNDYLKYFENQLVIPRCNSTKTLLENRLSALSQFFESSCIGGPWTSDRQFDNELKKKYPNLCSQCGSPESCSMKSGEEEVLLCLTDGNGEIAWSRLDYVNRHFKELNDNVNEFSFLCLNSSLKNLTDPDPCVWLEIPWRTVIARRDIVEEVIKLISHETNEIDSPLSLLQEDIRRVPVNVDILRTPNDYLKIMFPEFYSFKNHLQCRENNRVVRWCVISNLEAEKCQWISKIADSYGIEPLIKCIQRSSTESCIKLVKNGYADIFSTKLHEDLETRKQGLKPILHMVSKMDSNDNKIVSIVKKFSNFHSLEDLKNRKACFVSYKDAGWNTFLFMMKNLTGDTNWYCKDKEMVSQFFSQVSIGDLNKTNNSFPKNFVSTLSNVTDEDVNKRALNCLNFEDGDVAFVNLSSIIHYFPGSLENIYRLVCFNETKSNSEKMDNCYLSQTTEGSLMVHEKISKMRIDEIYLMLVDLDNLLKGHFQDSTPLLNLYGSFDGEKNVIFPENTQYLKRDVGEFQNSLNYHEILEDLVAQKCSTANSLEYKFYLIIFTSLVYFWSTLL